MAPFLSILLVILVIIMEIVQISIMTKLQSAIETIESGQISGEVGKYLSFLDRIDPEQLTFYLTIVMKFLTILFDSFEVLLVSSPHLAENPRDFIKSIIRTIKQSCCSRDRPTLAALYEMDLDPDATIEYYE